MATFNKFNAFVADVNNKVHNVSTDTLKFMLTNTAPVATNSVKADITEIAAGNGYTAGGATVAITSATQSDGTFSLVPASDVTFTASGGTMATFRYVVLYNSSTENGNLISWYDKGAAVTLNDTDKFTITKPETLYTMK